MKPNHIFIFCDNHNDVVNELVEFGFIEGSSRIHPNQGTKNRKFYFNDFYIEILWVYNIDEIRNKITYPTKLYERSKYKINDNSQFGLCVNYSKKDDELFKNKLDYKPTYLPKNMLIEVLTNTGSETLPWTFRWKNNISSSKIEEPINFPNQTLSKTIFGINQNYVNNNYLDLFKSNAINFENSKEIFLKLIFNNKKETRTKIFDTLPLIIEF